MPVTKHQKFQMKKVNRSDISGSKWNPRTISDGAKKKLQANLKRIGLLAPITVNEKTMELVGGHQRLACIDALEGSPDYQLDVAMVKLTDKQAKEAAIFLNNLDATGEWDLPMLAAILPELDLEHTGFEPISLDIIFADTEFSSMFSEKAQAPAAQETFGELAAMSAMRDQPEDVPGAGPTSGGDEEQVKRTASAQAVAEMRKTSKGMTVAEDTERYSIIIFNSRKERELFNERIGVDKPTRYVPFALLEPSLKTG
jgi:hypothetical protein